MFRALSAHLQEDTIVYMQLMVLSLSMRVPGLFTVCWVLPLGNTHHTVHTSWHPTLQHHNSYNRTETIGSETHSDLLMMDVKTPETC